MKFGDGLLGFFILALGVAVLWHVRSFPIVPGHFYGPGLFPGMIAVGLLACGSVLLLAGLRRAPAGAFRCDPQAWRGNPRGAISGVMMLATLLAFIFLGEEIGFQIIGFTAMTAFYLWLGRSIPMAVGVAAAVTLALDLLFRLVLHVPVPSGPLTNLW